MKHNHNCKASLGYSRIDLEMINQKIRGQGADRSQNETELQLDSQDPTLGWCVYRFSKYIKKCELHLNVM